MFIYITLYITIGLYMALWDKQDKIAWLGIGSLFTLLSYLFYNYFTSYEIPLFFQITTTIFITLIATVVLSFVLWAFLLPQILSKNGKFISLVLWFGSGIGAYWLLNQYQIQHDIFDLVLFLIYQWITIVIFALFYALINILILKNKHLIK